MLPRGKKKTESKRDTVEISKEAQKLESSSKGITITTDGNLTNAEVIEMEQTINCGNPLKQWVPIFCGCKMVAIILHSLFKES